MCSIFTLKTGVRLDGVLNDDSTVMVRLTRLYALQVSNALHDRRLPGSSLLGHNV
jgi:hypothetical protein